MKSTKSGFSQESKAADGPRKNFIRDIIDRDLEAGKYKTIVTRFPPEPNGYLHIGHAKSIVLNFGLAQEYAGRCHLRFDDTNPEQENEEYIESIKESVAWLGYDWGDYLYFASDYFEQLYQYAEKLIRDGKAYVDSLSDTKISEYRGTVNSTGKPSPYRDRTVTENIKLFQEMRAGKYNNGEHVLRAKINMASPHMIMRDPLLFRIKHAEHYRQGKEWCIYPMYDFAHPLEDAIEGVTHSLCTLEFDTNRVLYDWVLDNCLPEEELLTRPYQYEFARLNLSYTVMSKRKLRRLIEEDMVSGWDDPRLPTLSGLRRRGVTPESIRTFCQQVGVTRTESIVQVSHFEHALRDNLNYRAPRVNAVTNPLKVVITNFPEGETDWIEASYWPRDIEKHETRKIPFSKILYIEQDDFREDPPQEFHRLSPGREVRLRYGYFITCEESIKDEQGNITELRCRYDPETRGGDAPDGRSPGGTLHWVSADHAHPAEFRLYNRLFSVADPEAGEEDYLAHLNPDSLTVTHGFVEPSVLENPEEQRYQFERIGYFWPDPEEFSPDNLVFNQIVPLRDTWVEQEEADRKAEIEKQRQEKEKQKERQRQRSSAGQRDPADDLTSSQRARFEHYVDEYGLDREDAAIIARDKELTKFYEASLETTDSPLLLANWLTNRLLGVIKEHSLSELPMSAEQFGGFITLIDDGIISTKAADTVFEEMTETGEDPKSIVERLGLRQIEDEDALEPIIDDLLSSHPEEVKRFRDGKKALLGFFMGQIMQKTRGAANPELVKELLTEKLNG